MSLKPNLITRSLLSILAFLRETTACEQYATGKGFLQTLDPRIKTITFLLFIITTVSLKSTALISWLYLLCWIAAICSKVPIGFFLIRTWVFIPLFSLFIAIPALFNAVTPGDPLYTFSILEAEFIITRQGLDGAILFVIRITTAVSFAILLSLTTRPVELLKVLRGLGVPKVFVLTLSMCYRYLHLFAIVVENLFTAIKSRVGVVVQYKQGQQMVAYSIVNMWNRAYRMNEEVYTAMLSRGYTGEPKLLTKFHTRLRDWVWLSASIVVCCALFYWEHR